MSQETDLSSHSIFHLNKVLDTQLNALIHNNEQPFYFFKLLEDQEKEKVDIGNGKIHNKWISYITPNK